MQSRRSQTEIKRICGLHDEHVRRTLIDIPHDHVRLAVVEILKGRKGIMLCKVRERPTLRRHWDSRHPLDNIENCTGQLSGMPKYGEYGGVLGYYRGA